MRTPWTNIALFLALAVTVITGFFGLLAGESRQAWVLWGHGIAAYVIIVLFWWKAGIMADAWRRKKRWTRPRLTFLVTLILLLITLGLGLLWTFTGPLHVGGFSLVSLHIYLAVPVIALIAWHAWRMKFIVRVRGTFSRRLFLGSAAAALLGGLAWWGTGWLRAALALSGARRRFTGSYEWRGPAGTFPAVSWIADRPPPVDEETWRLAIGGAVTRPRAFSLAELRDRPAVEQEVVLDCTGGWYTTQTWRGVPLADLLREAGLQDHALSVTVEAVSGYRRRFGLDELDDLLLATAVAGRPLAHGHGAPLRLVVPGGRGFEWVKWVTAITVNTTPATWQSPLPLQ